MEVKRREEVKSGKKSGSNSGEKIGNGGSKVRGGGEKGRVVVEKADEKEEELNMK